MGPQAGTPNSKRSPRRGRLATSWCLSPRRSPLCQPFSRSLDDSSPSVLDAVGTAMVAAVALTADAAILNGAGGKAPLGVFGASRSARHRRGQHRLLIDAQGQISTVGGQGRVAYVAPGRHHALHEVKGPAGAPAADARTTAAAPLARSTGSRCGPKPRRAGDRRWSADPTQIVVAVRRTRRSRSPATRSSSQDGRCAG